MMMKTAIAAIMAATVAVTPVHANDELVRFGIGLGVGVIGNMIQGNQKPAAQPQQPRQQTPAAPRYAAPKVAPIPAPVPSFRLAATSTPVAPGQDTTPGVTLDHNGSVMVISHVNGLIRIDYAQPRAGLADIGVLPGTPVFEGALVQGRLMGEASAFKANCPPARYDVSGTLNDQGEIVLIGPGPTRDSCTITGFDPRSPHSVLEFTGNHDQLAALLVPQQITPPTGAEIAALLAPEIGGEPEPETVDVTPAVTVTPIAVVPAPAVLPAIEEIAEVAPAQPVTTTTPIVQPVTPKVIPSPPTPSNPVTAPVAQAAPPAAPIVKKPALAIDF